MEAMKKLLVTGVLFAALCGLAAPGAAKAYWAFPTAYPDQMWWTPSQPLHGTNCEFIYTNKGRACSGWNLFWELAGYSSGQFGFTCPGTGEMYTAFQNTTAVRGSIWNNYHSPCNSWETYIMADILPWNYFTSCAHPCYIKSSQYYWTGTSTVSRVLGFT